jgi:hypothetical protein
MAPVFHYDLMNRPDCPPLARRFTACWGFSKNDLLGYCGAEFWSLDCVRFHFLSEREAASVVGHVGELALGTVLRL